jgi:hypothetical protein
VSGGELNLKSDQGRTSIEAKKLFETDFCVGRCDEYALAGRRSLV